MYQFQNLEKSDKCKTEKIYTKNKNLFLLQRSHPVSGLHKQRTMTNKFVIMYTSSYATRNVSGIRFGSIKGLGSTCDTAGVITVTNETNRETDNTLSSRSC